MTTLLHLGHPCPHSLAGAPLPLLLAHVSSSTQLACSCLGRAGIASILCPALKPFWVGRSGGLAHLQSKDLFSWEDCGLASSCTALIHLMNFMVMWFLPAGRHSARVQVLMYTGRWGRMVRRMSPRRHSRATLYVISMYLCKSTVVHMRVIVRPCTNCCVLQPWTSPKAPGPL